VTTEVTWLRWLLENFSISVSMSTPLLSDSTEAISIARDPVKHKLTKHVGVDARFIRSHVQDGVVALQYVPSELQLWIFSRRLRLALIINFTYPNSVLLIHHEFERGEWDIRYVLVFSIIVFLQCFFVYSSPPVLVYIRVLEIQMNISDIYNTFYCYNHIT
jgi:hypothetical protein